VAAHPVRRQQAMDPEPVAAGLLHHNDRNRPTPPPPGALPQAPQQRKQARTIAGRNTVPAGLVLARRAGHDDPARQAEFQRHEQRGVHVNRRGIIGTGGGLRQMFNGRH
jgi:hypothetical protein